LGYSLPVAGVSEVGTAILCRDHPIGRFHQSCIRGKWDEPCDKCWKCFRKNTLVAALEGSEMPNSSVKSIRKSKEVRRNLIENKPVKHEGVLTYSLQRVSGDGEIIQSLRDLVRVGDIETDWMEHWYPLSSGLIDEGYEGLSVGLLKNYLGEMVESDINELHNWHNETSKDREKRLSEFISLI